MKERKDCTCSCHNPPYNIKHIIPCCRSNTMFKSQCDNLIKSLHNGEKHSLTEQLGELAESAVIESKKTAELDPKVWAEQLINSMRDSNGKFPND